MADGRKVVASEDNLRTALRQQLQHNEQQNLAMSDLASIVGRAGKMVAEIKKRSNKVSEGTLTAEAFRVEVGELIEAFETKGARGRTKRKRG